MNSTRLPNGDRFSKKQVEETFGCFVVDLPLVMGGGTFSLLLPQSWTPFPLAPVAEAPDPGDSVQLIAQFNGPMANAFAPFAQVQYAILDREISAANWLRFFCDRMNYNIRQIDAISPHIADALIGWEVGGRIIAARLVARFFGPEVFIVTVGVAAEIYESQKDLLGFIPRTFSVDGKTAGGTIESFRTIELNSNLMMSVPLSWEGSIIPGPDTLRGIFDLINRDSAGGWLGQIRVRWLDRSIAGDAAEEQKKVIKEFEVAGVSFGSLISSSSISSVSGSVTLVNQTVRKANLGGISEPLEFWLLTLRTQSFVLFAAALMPERGSQFYWWAVDRRALDILVGSIS